MKNLTVLSLCIMSMVKYSKKKVMILLTMEMMMLSSIMMISEKMATSNIKTSMLIIMSILMVTESVLGATIMIFHSRESNKMTNMSNKSF